MTVAINFAEIKWNPERVSNIKSIISRYKYRRISYASKIDDWKTFGKDNPTITLNVLYIKEKEICPD